MSSEFLHTWLYVYTCLKNAPNDIGFKSDNVHVYLHVHNVVQTVHAANVCKMTVSFARSDNEHVQLHVQPANCTLSKDFPVNTINCMVPHPFCIKPISGVKF